ncbi:MAG: DUF3108 domain-containing protein [Rhodobacteraceae bacterium]|nr:DUF3108 domain-containing protein [Paracoccaceae bacterium]
MPCAPAQCPPRHAFIRRFCVIAALLLVALPARAEQLWSVHTLGIKVGEFRLSVNETATAYAGRARFQTTGLADLFAGLRLDMTARGTLHNGMPRPLSYQGDVHTGRREARTRIDFSTTPPHVFESDDQPATPIPPDAMAGAFDPMTLLWLALRDRPEATCPPLRHHFDGTRVAALDLTTSERTDNSLTCHGAYIRLHGYSPEELADHTRAPMTVTYRPSGNIWRATRFTIETSRGRATLNRQD